MIGEANHYPSVYIIPTNFAARFIRTPAFNNACSLIRPFTTEKKSLLPISQSPRSTGAWPFRLATMLEHVLHQRALEVRRARLIQVQNSFPVVPSTTKLLKRRRPGLPRPSSLPPVFHQYLKGFKEMGAFLATTQELSTGITRSSTSTTRETSRGRLPVPQRPRRTAVRPDDIHQISISTTRETSASLPPVP